jgi:hypothetical protein
MDPVVENRSEWGAEGSERPGTARERLQFVLMAPIWGLTRIAIKAGVTALPLLLGALALPRP